jgi:oligopeptide/dipeptide ABC transporter ATP-binding protein
MTTSPLAPLLELSGLTVRFHTPSGIVEAVSAIDIAVAPGEIVGLVGESGSGKSTVCLAVMDLLGPFAEVAGALGFQGRPLGSGAASLRGRSIGMIFQEPRGSLDPVRTVGSQLAELLALHRPDEAAPGAVAIDLLRRVGLPAPERQLRAYPHELSGGMAQRVAIALALTGRPALLLADEPTTALDVTVQAQVLELLVRLREETGMAIVLVTHDLGVVAQYVDRVVVMRQGQVVEQAPVGTLFRTPAHEYTRQLLAALPRPGAVDAASAAAAPPAQPLLRVNGLARYFAGRRSLFRRAPPTLKAVDGVSFDIAAGETLAVVGESGCGKSTIALMAAGLIGATAGQVVFAGRDLAALSPAARRALRRQLQIVLQDPGDALDPRLSVATQVEEPLLIHRIGTRAERRERVRATLAAVGLEEWVLPRRPHEISGGQRQRVSLARALVLEPRMLVLDEPTSALDVSIQAQVIALLARLQRERNLAYLFISHDLRLVAKVADRVAVVYLGRIVELATAARLFAAPRHPYTQALLSAVPEPDPARRDRLRIVLAGEPPNPTAIPAGCRFRPRCRHAIPACGREDPPLAIAPDGRGEAVACHLVQGAA